MAARIVGNLDVLDMSQVPLNGTDHISFHDVRVIDVELQPQIAGVHRLDDFRIRRTAAEIPGQIVPDVVVARLGHAAEEIGRRHDEARRAEPALHGARLRERLLHRVERTVSGEALHGHHVVPVGLRGEDQARADELAVEKDRARAALALLAGVLGAGQLEAIAQGRQEALTRPDVRLARLAVPYTRERGRLRPIGATERFGSLLLAGVGYRGS